MEKVIATVSITQWIENNGYDPENYGIIEEELFFLWCKQNNFTVKVS